MFSFKTVVNLNMHFAVSVDTQFTEMKYLKFAESTSYYKLFVSVKKYFNRLV